MKSRSLALVLATLSLVACTGGGGGLGTGIDKGKLENQILTVGNQQLSARGVTMSSVSCVADTDAYHFKCIGYTNHTSNLFFTATCDTSGSCIWKEER